MLHELREEEAPAQVAEEAPAALIPSDVKPFFLGGLFVLALLASLYAAREIAMPIVLAFVLKLVLQPLLRSLQALHFPRTVAAIIILAVLISAIAGLGTAMSGPAAEWAEKLPQGVGRLQEELNFLRRPLVKAQKMMVHAENLAKVGESSVPVAVQGTQLSDKILAGTGSMVGELFTTLLILFFLLISGDTFLRRLVEVLPRFKDKRQAVDISQQIEEDISGYLLTITLMNAVVGIVTGIVVALTGMGDSVLWGTLAFVLNYVPVIGPLIGVSVLLLAGMMSNIDGAEFLPAGCYLFVNVLEGTLITPLLLARRFTLNPVLVVLSLVFWYWMWGVPGAILSMPMLAITKIICDRIQPLMPFGHFLEA